MTTEPSAEALTRIWSGEHLAYWRPDARGYTARAAQAWVLLYREARRCTDHCGPEKQIELELAVDCTAAYRQGIEDGFAAGKEAAARRCENEQGGAG